MNHSPNSEQPTPPAELRDESSSLPGRSEVGGPKSDPWNLASILPNLPARYQKEPLISFVRNILLANPLFPKLYADVVLSTSPNSKESKILRPEYQKILEKVNALIHTMAPTKTCTHIKVTGVRCGSPALYGERFCYFHQNAHRGVRKPPQSRLHPIAILEDEESIQSSLMEVINALMRNTIDLKRAELILRALHIAVKNSRRVKFDRHHDMIREVPDYPEPLTANAEMTAHMGTTENVERREHVGSREHVGRRKEVGSREHAGSREEVGRRENVGSREHVGTAAIGCPASEASAAPVAMPPQAANLPKPGTAGAEDELPAVTASQPKPVVEGDPDFWERWERGGQVLKQQEAERKAQAAAKVPAHDFKKPPAPTQAAPAAKQSVPEGRPKVAQRLSAGNCPAMGTRAVGTPETHAHTPPRKPAATAPAPKERKNAAHAVRHG